MMLDDLRKANEIRQGEWDPGSKITLDYRGNELMGEAGELCNMLKKMDRERLGLRGSRVTLEDLAAEMADVVICSDLLCRDLFLKFSPIQKGLQYQSASEGGCWLSIFVGRACDWTLSSNSNGSIEMKRMAREALQDVIKCVYCIADGFSINLDEAVRKKFNATSEKYGLTTRM